MDTVYPVLRDLAAAQLRRNSGVMTLQATELAHEAYERLAKPGQADWSDRDHFYAAAATILRHLVVDHVRHKGAAKRGSGLPLVSIEDVGEDQMPALDETVDWISIDEGIQALEQVDRQCARVVELKFFSGLTTAKIAQVSGNSVATVGRQWRFARAFLSKHLDDSPATRITAESGDRQ